MISIAMIVWRVLGGVFAPALGVLGTIAKWLFASPARLLIALCLILAAWGVWEHCRASKAIAAAQSCAAARKSDLAAAMEATAKAETNYRSASHAASLSYQAGQADAGRRFAAYSAGHSLRPGAPPPAAQPTQNPDPDLPAIPPAETVVAGLDRVWISGADWRACDADYDIAHASYVLVHGLDGQEGAR